MASNAILYPVVMIALAIYPLATMGQDRLKIRGVTAGDNVLVMMDSRTITGCSNDEVFPSNGNTELGNRLEPTTDCKSEITIFSTNKAMSFETRVTTWKNGSGDVHRTRLKPIINVPVRVWVTDREAWERAHDEMNNANLLYRQNKVGVQFRPVYRDLSRNRKGVDAIKKGIEVPFTDMLNARCTDLASVHKSGYYIPGRLNVYYVHDPLLRGRNCAIKEAHPVFCDCACAMSKPADGDGNITYVGSLIDLATLAHELGHAFGLRPGACGGHTKDIAGFSDDSIMLEGGRPTRNSFSLGQVFRMNTQDDKWGGTMLIKNGLRPKRDGRTCVPNDTSIICPALRTNGPIAGSSSVTGNTPDDLLGARYEELKEQGRKEPRFKMTSSKEEFIARYH